MDDIVQPLGRVIPIPKGDFVLGTEYKKFDVVRDTVKNAVYVAKKDNKDVALTDETNWMLLVKGVGDGSGGSDNNYTDADKAKVTALPEANPGTAGGLALYDALKAHLDDTANPHNVTAAQVGASNPNLLINGDFRNPVNQRSLTTYSMTSGVNGYTIDRWLMGANADTVSLTINSGYITLTNSSSINGIVCQRLEQYEGINSNYLAGKHITLSVKYRTTDATAYAYSWGMHNGIGIDIAPHLTFIKDGNWHNASVTFIVPENLTRFEPAGVSFFSGSIDLEYLKAEVGSVATPFVPRPYAEELALCQRYFYTLSSYYHTSSVIYGTNDEYFQLNLPVSMRTVPTFDFGVEGTDWAIVSRGGATVQSGFTLSMFLANNDSSILMKATKINHELADEATFKSLNFRVKSLDAEIY